VAGSGTTSAMSTNERSKRTYRKPELRSLGSIAATTKNMMMGSVTDMMGGLMNVV
jgi:hypothetical protein